MTLLALPNQTSATCVGLLDGSEERNYSLGQRVRGVKRVSERCGRVRSVDLGLGDMRSWYFDERGRCRC
jgi:hypothetical protein